MEKAGKKNLGVHLICCLLYTSGNDYYFFRSSSSHSRRVKFSLPHGYRIPYILNPYTGEADEAPVYEAVGNHLLIELDFDPYGSYLLELKDLPSARRHHLLKAPQLKTIREENRLVAYASGQGEYSFILSHGETKRIIPAGPFPEPLKINRWQFDTVYRDAVSYTHLDVYKRQLHQDYGDGSPVGGSRGRSGEGRPDYRPSFLRSPEKMAEPSF